MAHPQSSPRGLVAHKRIDINGNEITGDSTGIILEAGVKICNKANAILTGNSTGVAVSGGLNLSSTSDYVTVDSTGYLIGSRYISTNTTGNLTT